MSKKNNNSKGNSTKTQVKSPDTKIQKPHAPTIVVDLFEAVLGKKSFYLLSGILLLLLLFLFGGFLFGDRLFLFKDIGSDSINYYYPQMVNVAAYLEEYGIPSWSFNLGMGQNMLPLSIGDPFMWPLYLIGKENLAYGIAWMEVLKFLSAGLLFYNFLRMLKMSYHSSIIGALAYSFSGFMVIGSGWYVFSTQGVYIAALLLGFELLFQKKIWWLFSVAVFFLAGDISFYLYFGALLILVYGSLRMVDEYGKDYSKYLWTYLNLILFGALGVLMSSFLLISTVDQMLNSPRVSGESAYFKELLNRSPFAPGDIKHNLTVISRIFANDLIGDANYKVVQNPNAGGALTNINNFSGWQNYLEAPMLYCGLFTLLLLPQALFLSRGKKRIIFSLGFLFVVIPIMFPFLRNAIWLFTGDYYRIFSLFFIISFLLIALNALELIYKKRQLNYIVLFASLIFWLVMLFAPFGKSPNHQIVVDEVLRNIIVMFLLTHTFIIAGLGISSYRQTSRIAMIGMVALELLLISSYSHNNSRPVITKTEFKSKQGYNDYTVDALDKIRKKDKTAFYRISKYYQSGTAMHGSTNDARVQGYFSTLNYHSFNQKNYIKFLGDFDIIDTKDEFQTRWAKGLQNNPLLQIIASNKYMFVKNVVPPFPGYSLIDSVGDVKIFENNNFLPLGFTYDNYLSESEFKKLSKDNGSLKKQIAVLKALVIEDSDLTDFKASKNLDTNSINMNYSLEELDMDVKELKSNTLQITSFKETNIVGKIKLDKPEALFFSIPFDPSWSAKVDGKRVKLYRANLGLMALPLTAGEHSIELSFTPPFWNLSLMLSGLGFTFFVVLLLWGMLRKNK